ncbi:MAG: thioredoxin family protein [Desulfobacterales bacterium]
MNTLDLTVGVRHIAYTTDEARRFAAALGLVPGTAKDVAAKAAIDVNWDRVHGLIEEPGQKTSEDRETSCCPTAAAKWTLELDETLRPCERIARETGIMMTPALILNGCLLHQGSVPERPKVISWIQEYFGKDAQQNPHQYTMEVLGPGCPKCDELYDNVVEAVFRSGLRDMVSVRKRTDIAYFKEMGVAVTPALVLNGIVVSKGKVLTIVQARDQLNNYLSA